MAKAVLIVESCAVSPERDDEFRRWYAETHLAETVALDGFVSGRFCTPVDGEARYVAVYEIEHDDLSSIMGMLGQAAMDGTLQMSDSMMMDPPPRVQLLEVSTAYP